MAQEEKRKCFVIMPFSETTDKHTEEYWNTHYTNFLKPEIESLPLVAHRSSPLRGDIIRQIITDLVTSFIVVADLTDSNPNVYWELGVRQSFKHGTITIAEYGTDLPSDMAAKGTLYYYPNDHVKMRQFTKQLSSAIKDCMENPSSPDSQVLETIVGKGTLFQIIMKEESLRKLDAILEEIKYNSGLFKNIDKLCKDNFELRKKNKPDECKCQPFPLSLICLETLIVNRYVHADSNFYGLAADSCVALKAFNNQLSVWMSTQNPEYIERELVDKSLRLQEILKVLQEFVLSEKERLSSLP